MNRQDKWLWVAILAVTVGLAFCAWLIVYLVWSNKPVQQPSTQAPKPAVIVYDEHSIEAEINAYRISKGLLALPRDEELCMGVQAKLDDMVARQYYTHNTPDGERFFTFYKRPYRQVSENLAANTNLTSVRIVQLWKNSPSHNEAMLGNWQYQCAKTYTGKFLTTNQLTVSWFVTY